MACRSCKAVLDLPSISRSQSIPLCLCAKRSTQPKPGYLAARSVPQQQRRHVHEIGTAANLAGNTNAVAAKKATNPATSANEQSTIRPLTAGEKLRMREMIQGGRPSRGLGQSASLTDRLGAYEVYGLTKQMLDRFAAEADYHIRIKARHKDEEVPMTEDGEEIGKGGGIWHEDFALLPTFSTWAQVTMLHMWLVTVRLRCLPEEGSNLWRLQLVDHYFHEAEAKMEVEHRMTSKSIRQRYLKDLFNQWRGAVMAYDEGLVRGDAVLAGAVWRNLFKAREDVDVRALAAIVSWMRRCLRALDQLSDRDFCAVFPGHIFKFTPKSEQLFVDQPVRGLEQVYPEASLGKGKSDPRPEGRAADTAT